MDKREKVSKLCCDIADMLSDATEGMDDQDTFEVMSNVVLKLTTYPMSILNEEGQETYMENFIPMAKKLMKSYIEWENNPPTEH